ncbi:MAG: molybdopterin-dependent oxidoreductase [Acidobacteriaceae bacterium]|jgi:anaerobic selenocysteine-containing dehydrogenase
MGTERETRVVHAVCSHDCPDSCGVLVTVESLVGADGSKTERAVKVEGDPGHPVTQGFLCGKVAQYLERVYSPERLLYPMRRKAGRPKGPAGYGGVKGHEADAFERISWDEALEFIAKKLTAIAAEFGPESVLPYSYAGTIGQLGFGSMDRRLFHRMGASQLARTICSEAGGVALKQVYGVKLGTPPEDFAHAGLVIAWGANIHGNNIHLWPFVEEARRKGARLVVIDPYRTRTAAVADEHLAIRPGTDTMLALAMMRVIFREGLEDREYMAACTVGGAELRMHALRDEHRPERAAAVTGIAAERIVALARAYGMAGRGGMGPAAIRLNYGIQRSENGGTAVRAVAMLPLITGAWKRRGGGLQLSTSGAFPFNSNALQMPELMMASPLGREARTINMSRLGEALGGQGTGDREQGIGLGQKAEADSSASLRDDKQEALTKVGNPMANKETNAGVSPLRSASVEMTASEGDGPPVKALFVYNSNPAAVAPNQNAVLRGMMRPDLFTVVHEQFFTDTTDYADVVLPAPTFLEVKDVQGAYGHLYAQVSERAIAPLGEARSNVRMFGELAQRMGFTEACFRDTEDELIDQALTTDDPFFAGVTRERMEREGQVGLALPVNAAGESLPFSTAEWFRTASGRGELTPVPVFVAPTESRGGSAARSGEYPLEFLGRKSDNYMNSTFANIPRHQRMEAKTLGLLEMCAADAAARGIETGDAVEVFNGRGRIGLWAQVGDAVPQGVVAARLNWNKLGGGNGDARNVNALTSEIVTDIGGGATFYSTLVEVRKS